MSAFTAKICVNREQSPPALKNSDLQDRIDRGSSLKLMIFPGQWFALKKRETGKQVFKPLKSPLKIETDAFFSAKVQGDSREAKLSRSANRPQFFNQQIALNPNRSARSIKEWEERDRKTTCRGGLRTAPTNDWKYFPICYQIKGVKSLGTAHRPKNRIPKALFLSYQ
jgi:hypothetical protein